MECRSTIGKYDNKTDSYNLYCSVRAQAKKKLSIIFNIDENKVNVFTPDVGGGFGMKIFNYQNTFLHLLRLKLPIKQ